jgi:hypothetical protein
LFRNLMMAAVAALTQGCQQPAQDLGNKPQASREPAYGTVENRTVETRLSFRGIGVDRSGRRTVGGATAILDGVLSRVGNCLIVTAPNGIRVQPVFLAGTATWNAEAETLVLRGKNYRLGDRIRLGGGGVAPSSAHGHGPGVEIVDCEVDELFAVSG